MPIEEPGRLGGCAAGSPLARRRVALLAAAAVAAFAGAGTGAITAAEPPGDLASSATAYQEPPAAITALVDAPPVPTVSVGPGARYLLVQESPGLPPLAEVARPELRLAGLRFDPAQRGPSRQPYFARLQLLRLPDGEPRPVAGLPPEARLRNVGWSPDGRWLALTVAGDGGSELWVVETATAAARRLLGPRLNLVTGPPYDWLPDSSGLLARLVPAQLGPAPPPPALPAGPNVQESLGRRAAAPTYQDLLRTPHDADLLEHYLQAQLAVVGLDGGVTEVGAAGAHVLAEVSPDGRWLLVRSVGRPYSALVPLAFFPERTEVWDRRGGVVRTVADLPLAEEVPIGHDAVRAGPRRIAWRADAPATLAWAEALDGGDPRRDAALRDRVCLLPAPFVGQPAVLISLAERFAGLNWGTERLALVAESWWKTRHARAWLVDPSRPGAQPAPLYDRSAEDRYHDPGTPMLARTASGTWVLRLGEGGRCLYLRGDGASPEGDRPFLDRFDLASRRARRLWRSAAPHYETVLEILDAERGLLLTRREGVDEPPNCFVRDLRRGGARAVTRFPHPQPQLRAVRKELLRYRRADGVDLTGTLYWPAAWDSMRDSPLPLLMWAYPQEYASAAAAGQVADSPYRFVRATWSSPVPWVLLGYAVLDNPSLPIIGEGGAEPNDTYVAQLVAGAQAAVDAVTARGLADPARLAVGGHSYGAFMTANLLAHSDLFRAGVARSGAYNRTLTPFGFQAEERTLWEAAPAYLAMSPFLHADRIDEPLLLVHGEADNNSGTHPLQSERFFQALQGNGGVARLVMLPYESHGYRARESVLHVLWETWRWLETHVKSAGPRPAPAGDGSGPPGRGDAGAGARSGLDVE